jgi:hypothetical protein
MPFGRTLAEVTPRSVTMLMVV